MKSPPPDYGGLFSCPPAKGPVVQLTLAVYTCGETDIIFVLQPSDSQLQTARDAGAELRPTPIAKEAFVFFVSERNPVLNLSIEQIQNIYLKKITKADRKNRIR
jgi:ABC-type phosphate transport system substrate-binding protein